MCCEMKLGSQQAAGVWGDTGGQHQYGTQQPEVAERPGALASALSACGRLDDRDEKAEDSRTA